MKKEIISAGAEAIIYQEGNKIIKKRINKSYRHKELDKKIIKRRTKSETKILTLASSIISVPLPEKQTEENKIIMPFIKGDKLSSNLDLYPEKTQKQIMKKIGESIAKLHEKGIIHGDLTTSNMIYIKEKKEIYFIDFGLGFLNGKYENKGVDIHLLKQALEAKHFKNWQKLFEEFEKGYASINPKESKKVFDKLKLIEKRGRYKH